MAWKHIGPSVPFFSFHRQCRDPQRARARKVNQRSPLCRARLPRMPITEFDAQTGCLRRPPPAPTPPRQPICSSSSLRCPLSRDLQWWVGVNKYRTKVTKLVSVVCIACLCFSNQLILDRQLGRLFGFLLWPVFLAYVACSYARVSVLLNVFSLTCLLLFMLTFWFVRSLACLLACVVACSLA